MDKSGLNPAVLLSFGVIGVALLYVSIKGAKNTGVAIGTSAVDLVDGVIGGASTGAGLLVGVPATNPDKCAAAMAAGDTWEASFACPAPVFVKWLWTR